MAAASWITSRAEDLTCTSLDGGDAAEEEVPARPAADIEPLVLERGCDLVGPAALDVHDVTVDVEPRPRDRLVDGQPVADDGIDDLQDRARKADGAGAPRHEPRPAFGIAVV